MKFRKLIIPLVIIAALSLLALPKLLTPNKQEGASPKAGGKGIPVNVSVVIAGQHDVSRTIQVTGNIKAMEEVELHPEIAGRVVKIAFNEGTEVQKGQLLMKINDQDLTAQLKKAMAVKQLKTMTEERNKQLLQKGAISQEVYDITLSERQSAEADAELIREQIRRTEILAPFSGTIGLRDVSEGAYVTPATKIATLHTVNQVKLEFAVPEKYAPILRKGATVTFQADGLVKPGNATIFAIEPGVDPVTRNVMMRAICDNPDHRLIPGAFVSVQLQLSSPEKVIMIPTQSVVPVLKGQKVFVVIGDSAVERKIVTGTRNDAEIEVKEGLNPGDAVVVNGVMYMRQGVKVKIK